MAALCCVALVGYRSFWTLPHRERRHSNIRTSPSAPVVASVLLAGAVSVSPKVGNNWGGVAFLGQLVTDDLVVVKSQSSGNRWVAAVPIAQTVSISTDVGTYLFTHGQYLLTPARRHVGKLHVSGMMWCECTSPSEVRIINYGDIIRCGEDCILIQGVRQNKRCDAIRAQKVLRMEMPFSGRHLNEIMHYFGTWHLRFNALCLLYLLFALYLSV